MFTNQVFNTFVETQTEPHGLCINRIHKEGDK